MASHLQLWYQLPPPSPIIINPRNVCSNQRAHCRLQSAVDEGAKMVFDGCNTKVKKGYDNGSFVGATIIPHVKPHMYVAHLACLCC